MSLKSEILEMAMREYPNLVGGIKIEQLALRSSLKGSNASRRARELVKERKLEAVYVDGHVEYRYIKLTREEEEKTTIQRALGLR